MVCIDVIDFRIHYLGVANLAISSLAIMIEPTAESWQELVRNPQYIMSPTHQMVYLCMLNIGAHKEVNLFDSVYCSVFRIHSIQRLQVGDNLGSIQGGILMVNESTVLPESTIKRVES